MGKILALLIFIIDSYMQYQGSKQSKISNNPVPRILLCKTSSIWLAVSQKQFICVNIYEHGDQFGCGFLIIFICSVISTDSVVFQRRHL